MVVAEALVLLAMGLLAGILSTIFDVLVTGAASFVSHFGLWVLLNALIAVHVESRVKAIWWAIPFNLGYIEAYFITTVASYEGYTKSLMVPLAGVALIAPFLTYAMWTAKEQKNLYGKFLSVLIVVGTLVVCYMIDKHMGIYDVVTTTLLALLLLVIPTRRLSITRAKRVVTDTAAQGTVEASDVRGELVGDKPRRRRGTVRKSGQATGRVENADATSAAASSGRSGRRGDPSGAKKPPIWQSRKERAAQEQARERRRSAGTRRRARRVEPEVEQPQNPTLGNARPARRSTRSA